MPALSAGASKSGRIAPLDGLRSIAVLGVLYVHAWSIVLGTPAWTIAKVDVNRLLSVFGTGVDLFFVISGFCMYLMYGSRQQDLDWRALGAFVRNRFRRIAPAYYVAVLVSGLFVWNRTRYFPASEVIVHLAFGSTLMRAAPSLATSFWSLATEWHFYLLLPALVHVTHRIGFRRTMFGAMSLGILFRCGMAALGVEWHGLHLDHLIPSRFVEFGWGIIAARLYLNGREMPRILRGNAGFVAGWCVSLIGRAMMTDAARRVPFLGSWLQELSIVVLSFGFMLVVWNVVSQRSWFATRLASKPMRWIGKVSYSLYLWHWDIGLAVVAFLSSRYGVGPASPILYTAAALIVLLPLSALSYRWLEAPYFHARHRPSAANSASS